MQALAAERGVPVSFHIYPEVSVHLGVGEPGRIVETFDPDLPGGNPLDPAHLLVQGGPRLAGGMAVAPDAPGLGFELDWAALRLTEPRAASSRRSSARRILPVTVSGSSATNSIVTGHLERREPRADVLLQLGASSGDADTPATVDDERLHDLAAHRVGDADRGRDRHRGWRIRHSSISPGPMRWPPLEMRSSARPMLR